VTSRLLDAWRARRPGLSLRATLMLVLLLATVPMAALMSWQIVDDLRSDEARRQARLASATAALAMAVERELDSSIDALNILALSDKLRGDDLLAFERWMRAAGRLRGNWHSAFLIDAAGRVLIDTGGGPREASAAQRGPLQRVLAGEYAAVSNLDTEAGSRQYATMVMVPVRVNDKPRYALGVWIPVRHWQSLIEQAVPLDAGVSTLCDAGGRVIARTRSPERFIAQPACGIGPPHGFGRQTLAEGEDAWVARQSIAPAGWSISLAHAAAPLEQAQRRAVALATATVAGCLLLGLWIALFVARRMTRPLERLAAGHDAGPATPLGVREIDALRAALRTARERSESAQAELQRRVDEFETLFKCTPIGLAFAHDSACTQVTRNAALERMFGLMPTREDAGAAAWVVMRDDRVLPPAEWPLCVAARTGEAVETTALSLRRPGEPRRHVLVSAAPLHDDAGRPRGAIAAVVDISEQVGAHALLAQSNQRLRESQHLVQLAQEVGQVGFCEYDVAQDLITWTPGQAHLFGWDTPLFPRSLGELLSQVHDEDRRSAELALLRAFAARRPDTTVEYRIALAGGQERWISTRVAIRYAEDGRPARLVSVSIDVSDRRRVEQANAALMEHAQQARDRAEAANRAKDELLAMLGHELRNPLGAIASAAEVLETRPAPEVAASAAAIIARQTRHLTRMMAEMLETSRLMSGQLTLARQPLDLAQPVERALAALQPAAAASRHRLEGTLAPVWVEADALRIEQVVSQLVGNALKYTPAGTRVEVTVAPEGDEAVLRVRDGGPGIAPELLPQVFDLFVQGTRPSDRRDGGLGLGLTFVKRLVEMHAGTVTVESSAGGTCFEVRLRAVLAPAPDWHPPLAPRRVLVIEDNADALTALRSLLSVDGHEVLSESDGGAGLAAVLAQRPDLVIVDIGLPTLDGLQIARRARAEGYPGRMVALTGYGRDDDVRRSLKAGFDAHLVKPVHREQLRRQLAEA